MDVLREYTRRINQNDAYNEYIRGMHKRKISGQIFIHETAQVYRGNTYGYRYKYKTYGEMNGIYNTIKYDVLGVKNPKDFDRPIPEPSKQEIQRHIIETDGIFKTLFKRLTS